MILLIKEVCIMDGVTAPDMPTLKEIYPYITEYNREMEAYLNKILNMPEDVAKKYAMESLVSMGLLDENGEFTDQYKDSRDYYGCKKMLQLKDFIKGDMAYIVIHHHGRNETPEIREVKVLSVGKKYVTVSSGYKFERNSRKFERIGNIKGLLEHCEFGEQGILYNTKLAAEDEIERKNL